MAIPLLIDTDMGIDDAVAVSLLLASDAFDVRAVVGVGGNVPIEQVMANIARLLGALSPPAMPVIGRGLDQGGSGLIDRRDEFGEDGFGECNLPDCDAIKPVDFKSVYGEALEAAAGALAVLAIGPLTNLAALLRKAPDQARSIKQLCLMGGAVWTRGNATETAEFNFHRDPNAAAAVLASGLPITVAPLDVTGLVCLDESHVAHMAASGYRTGEVLAPLLRHAIGRPTGPGVGKALIHDAVAAGSILWPKLFLKTRMRLDVTTGGEEAGRSKPALGGDKSRHVDLLTAVGAADFLENMLESLCHEAFVV